MRPEISTFCLQTPGVNPAVIQISVATLYKKEIAGGLLSATTDPVGAVYDGPTTRKPFDDSGWYAFGDCGSLRLSPSSTEYRFVEIVTTPG
jgi:hypothetical protein